MMKMPRRDPNFFISGGTLPPDAPSYVKRSADEILPKLVGEGELCYILNTRQMGKSSLIARTIYHLEEQQERIQPVFIDLSAIGITTIEQWYYSLIDEIAYQLNIARDVQSWWRENAALEYVSRFIRFFAEIILKEVEDRIAIFIDEIDFVTKFPFSDDFFATIRALYNRRPIDKAFGRVIFILVGTLTPHDLIKDPTRTPFNVGQRIKLDDLKLEDAQVMVQGLPHQSKVILERIFYWTDGHPYLTQKIGQAITTQGEEAIWTDEGIDSLIHKLFLTGKALLAESNLQFIRDRLLSSPQKDKLLKLYRQIYKNGKKIKNDEQSIIQNELKLSGLVKVNDQEYLTVRNRIYEQAFDLDWIKENQPRNWWPWITVAVVLMGILIVTVVLGYVLEEKPPVIRVDGAIYTDQPPLIDGYLDDESWLQAQPFILATHHPANDATTVEVRLLWDDRYLYAGFEVNDTQVEGSNITPWDGDSVSVIIKNGPLIREYRHSLLGEDLADTKGDAISKHYLKETTTFDDPANEDVGYSVEMQIPWATPPPIGSVIASDLLSVDHDKNPGGKYNDSNTVFSKISWDGDQSVDTAMKSLLLSGPCLYTKITSPEGTDVRANVGDFLVSNKLRIFWEPTGCKMTVQYYKNNELEGEYKGLASGAEINIGEPASGETEIKILNENAPQPSDTVWVWVE